MNLIKMILLNFILLWGMVSFAAPQEAVPPETVPQAPEPPKPGEPRVLEGESMITADGVHLSATYYRGAAGKESIPVLLLHGKNGSQNDFNDLIPELTKKGMAVLVPDLRGHGKSTIRTVQGYKEGDAIPAPSLPPRGGGAFLPAENPVPNRHVRNPRKTMPYGRRVEPIDPITREEEYRVDDFTDEDYLAIIDYDFALLRAFLIYENNNEQLNLSKLVIVGVDMGATLGAVWAKNDWTPSGNQKITKHTKSVIMISPVEGQMTGLLSSKSFRDGVFFMLVVGKNSAESLESAKKICEHILAGKEDMETNPLKSKCPIILCDTEKQGSSLFRLEKPNLRTGIPLFIEDRIGKLEDKAKWMRIRE